MSWLCRKYHVILRLKISSFELLSKYKMLFHPFKTCFWLEACTQPLHQSLKNTLIFKHFNHASQQFGQKEFWFDYVLMKGNFGKEERSSFYLLRPFRNRISSCVHHHRWTWTCCRCTCTRSSAPWWTPATRSTASRRRMFYKARPLILILFSTRCYKNTFWVDSPGWRYCYPSHCNSSQILLGWCNLHRLFRI